MSELIVYYSRKGENYVSGTIKNLNEGNTNVAAKMIQRAVGADIFELVPQNPYSDNYNECIEQAKRDRNNNTRPELKSLPETLNGYDTIYLGYPNYWGTMPMCVFTFLEHYNFAGKTIRPFCTNEGSGMGNSMEDIKKICQGAKVTEGLSLHGGSVNRADNAIADWL